MPRTPDPNLELRILKAATQLLDKDGRTAVTMRSVAATAGTTTPTLYERFPSKEALDEALYVHISREVRDAMAGCRDIPCLGRRFLDHIGRYPNRLLAFNDAFGSRLQKGQQQPVLGLLRERLQEELGVSGQNLDYLALSIAALMLGTARAVAFADPDSPAAKNLRRAALRALKQLITAVA